MLERLNGEDGLGAIFPAMVNALEVMVLLGYPARRPAARDRQARTAEAAGDRDSSSAYCQPCVSPIWDTALGQPRHAGRAERLPSLAAATRALDWLQTQQLLDEARRLAGANARRLRAAAGRFSSQTATTRTSMTRPWSPGPCTRRANPADYTEALRRALDWLVGMQSRNGGFAAFDADNTSLLSEQDPVRRSRRAARSADQRRDGARRDGARVARPPAGPAGTGRALAYLRDRAGAGRLLVRPLGHELHLRHLVGADCVRAGGHRRGGSGGAPRGRAGSRPAERAMAAGARATTAMHDHSVRSAQTSRARLIRAPGRCWRCWPSGEVGSEAVRRGVEYLLRTQQADGLWSDPSFTAPGFPRVFYLKYHGYCAYFPLWALAAYRTLSRTGTRALTCGGRRRGAHDRGAQPGSRDAAAAPAVRVAQRRHALAVSGMGAAAAACGALHSSQAGATALVSWGMAGGLDPALAAGDICLPSEVVAADGRRVRHRARIGANASRASIALSASAVVCGRLLTSSRAIGPRRRRRRPFGEPALRRWTWKALRSRRWPHSSSALHRACV